jgi:hypothetical protein
MQSEGIHTFPWQFVVKLCTIEGQVPGRLADTSHCSPLLRLEMASYLCPDVFCEVLLARSLLHLLYLVMPLSDGAITPYAGLRRAF